MREIEVKACIRDSTQLKRALRASGIRLGKPVTQHDVVYSPPGAQSGQNVAWLRIRTENGRRTILTMKRRMGGGAHLDKVEHEVVVSDAGELANIITHISYELFSDLTKIRRAGHSGDVEICLDEVLNLGIFIEAERLCSDDADGAAVQAELWQLLGTFGITESDRLTKGYDVLMRQKLGLV